MEFPIGVVLLLVASFYVSIKLWMVNHAARLSERNGAISIWDGVVVPAPIFITGIYCLDEARRRGHWFEIKGYIALTAALMAVLFLFYLGARLLGHHRRCGRWTLGRSSSR